MNTSIGVKGDKVYAPKVSLNVNGVPEELKAYPQWVLWIGSPSQNRPGKIDKVPYQVNGFKASTTNPKTWTTFEKAVDALQTGAYHGVGFVFTKQTPFSGTDIDSCIQDGKIDQYAKELLAKLASYTEISPSGSGFHTIVKGKLPGTRTRKKGSHVEIYSTGRFFTITGNRFGSLPDTIEDRQDVLNKIYKEMFEPDKSALPASPKVDISGLSMSDGEVLFKAKSAKNSQKFTDLWEGRWETYHGSHSEADSALCFMLAFWTMKNAEQMDRLFRVSGLYRKKWDEKRGEKTYGQITIEKAIEKAIEKVINLQSDVYDPSQTGTLQQKALGIWGEDGNLMADGVITQEELAQTDGSIFPRLNPHLEEDNFIVQYMDYAGKLSDAYSEYNFATGITMLSIVARKRFCVKLSIGKIYPNTWSLLLGDSTSCRKSTAQDNGEKIVNVVLGPGMPQKFSPESFIEILSNRQKNYLFIDEFSGLLASMQKTYMAEMRDMLCTLYDCKGINRVLRTSQRKGAQTEFYIPEPYLTMSGATTLDNFKENSQTLDVTSGWLLRFLYYCPDYPKESRPIRGATDEDDHRNDLLLTRLADIRDKLQGLDIGTLMNLEPEAWAYFQTWQLEEEKKVFSRKDRIENSIFGRLTIYALKLAMLFTLGRSDFAIIREESEKGLIFTTTPISLAHIKEACRLICDYFMPTERVLVEEVASNAEKNLQVKIKGELRRNGGKLRQRDLAMKLHMPKRLLGEAIDGLKFSGEICIKIDKRRKDSIWVILTKGGVAEKSTFENHILVTQPELN